MIIKNYPELAITPLRMDALKILSKGVEAVLPPNILKNKISFREGILRIDNKFWKVKGDLYIIGFGKASGFMAEQIEKVIGISNIKEGIVIDKTSFFNTTKIKVLKGSHPIPNDDTLEASKKIISLLKKSSNKDTILCLISGGGSSMFTLPVKGISLLEIQELTNLLLKSGAEVYEINILRKHLSEVKGGKLLRKADYDNFISVIFSDTLDKVYDATASGPTSPDNSTFEDAYRILKKYGLLEEISKNILDYIQSNLGKIHHETLKSGNPLFNKVHNIIVADNNVALAEMKKFSENLGYTNVNILTNNLKGESKHVAKKMGDFFNTCQKGVYLYAGETIVIVRGDGKGGRLQEYIASIISQMNSKERWVAASLGSDGVDFIEGIGGAIADHSTSDNCKKHNLDPNEFLENNNTYFLHKKLGNLLESNPTNTNVADLHIFIKEDTLCS